MQASYPRFTPAQIPLHPPFRLPALVNTSKLYFLHLHQQARNSRDARKYDPDPAFSPTVASGHEDAIELKNAKASIAKLPMELVLDIFGMLDVQDQWSFQITCRHIAKQVDKAMRRTNETIPDKYAEYGKFLYKRRLAQFDRIASDENADDRKDNKLLCCWCLDLHPRSYFLPNEVEKAAQIRQCIGVNAKIFLCSHNRISWSELVQHQQSRFYYSPYYSSPTKLNCTQPDCSRYGDRFSMMGSSDCFRHSFSFKLPARHTMPSLEIFVNKPTNTPSERVPNAPRLPELPVENRDSLYIKMGLLDLNEYICPHIKSSDRQCYAAIRAIALKKKKPKMVLREGTDLWPVSEIHCKCQVQGCETTFSVDTSKYKSKSGTGVLLKVIRDFGKIHTVMDESWLAMADTGKNQF